MPYFANETRLLNLLQKHNHITEKQRKMVEARKAHVRQQLLRQRQKQARGKKQAPGDTIDLIDILVSQGLEDKEGQPLTEEIIIREVADKLGMPFKKLDPLELDLELVTKTIPRSFAVNHLLLPFAVKNGVLEVAMYDPDNRPVLEEIERVNQTKVRPYLATKSDIRKMLAEFFGFQSSITAAETRLGGPTVDLGNLEQYVRISSSSEISSSDQHITSAVDHLFSYAFDQRASDIHIEPKKKTSQVRLRIDGVLHTIYKLPKAVHAAILSRIKTLARLDIAEKRRPQDGRIRVDRDGKQAEIRVSTIPVAFGEKVVMRILDPDILFQDMESLGFSERDLGVYNSFLAQPHGMILVTGPTGSGKSTTLYSTLKYIATPEINLITIEDPIEMVHEEFNQIAVQPQIDITFSSILRNILRQDPDVIMIGEIRDLETARNAMQASLTGHLVFSTLHTNDAISSITRLVDLGVKPFLVSSTLLGTMAQRLVRTICPHCPQDVEADVPLLRGYGFPVEEWEKLVLKQGAGCRHCRGTGYLGRSGIFEIFAMSDAIMQLTTDLRPEAEIRVTALKEGMTTLKQDAWRKVIGGITTYQEAIRVAGSD